MGNEASQMQQRRAAGGQVLVISYYQWFCLQAPRGTAVVREEKQTPFTKKHYLKLAQLNEPTLDAVFCFAPVPLAANGAPTQVVKAGDVVELVCASRTTQSIRPTALGYLQLGDSAAKDRVGSGGEFVSATADQTSFFRVTVCGTSVPVGQPIPFGLVPLSFESLKKPGHFCLLGDETEEYVRLVKRPQGPPDEGLVAVQVASQPGLPLPSPLTVADPNFDATSSSSLLVGALAASMLDDGKSQSGKPPSQQSKAAAAATGAVANAAQKRYEKNPEKMAQDARKAAKVGKVVAGNKTAQKFGGMLLRGAITGAANAATSKK